MDIFWFPYKCPISINISQKTVAHGAVFLSKKQGSSIDGLCCKGCNRGAYKCLQYTVSAAAAARTAEYCKTMLNCDDKGDSHSPQEGNYAPCGNKIIQGAQ
jgi:hypothetical protein